MSRAARAWDAVVRFWDRWRPLDPVPSIKLKFAMLVTLNLVLTAGVTWYANYVLGWRVRYGMIIASLIVLAVSQIIGHGMTLPLRQMTAAVRELAAGRPAPRLQTNSRDEVGELARAFTAMAAELAVADQQRRQLLADVGHELRTPVAALRAQVENLVDGVRTPDEQALGEVLAQVERLGDRLTHFLQLASADGGAQRLERRRVDVRALVDPVVAEIRAARPGATITVDVPPGLIVDADPDRLAQVLTNLLDNAARHAVLSPAGDAPAVTLTAEVPDASSSLVLEVTDNGPGIPPDRWTSVFERFASGPDAAVPGGTRLDGGTGLGLAIARWAVVLHGGRIAVVPAEGGGCRIRVEIPARGDLHETSTP
ncbi:HAMP domain-containing sensor histidine kinase [Kineosporia succinea]|uniref:Signal transduction histidine-protein kinase/phosphatase MprB n=1 Tax=Kineosporia succinea TaxID=84632 RepID=A0ABT9PAQ4_9ACTN|nr:HAMP domain-containing sensor histidine kinase [Kineosporia succinea]MDP9829275.1 signal transduction histidine kinase [Kineosporia succinea]